MSAISELINQLCPNGVEYKTLGEVGRFFGGLTGKNKGDFEEGNAKYISYMNVFSNSAVDVNVEDRVRISVGERQNVLCYGDVLFTGSSETPEECGMTSVLATHTDEPLYLNSFCIGFRLACPRMYEPCFLKHLLRANGIRKQVCKTASGVTRFNVSKVRLAKVEIPVPPLPVQQVIVRRLDAMTGLIEDLEKELAARQKQYEWVREETFKQLEAEGVERKKLGEIVEIIRGERITKRQISDVGDYPVISGGTTPMGYYSQYNRDADSITIAQYGTAGFVDWQTKRFWANDVCYCLQLGGNVDGRFLFFSLKQIQDQIFRLRTNAVPACLPRERLAGVEVFLPSVPIQQKIVRRLDEMTELIAGIEKEIALRKQQYEYCREKLLTFTRAG